MYKFQRLAVYQIALEYADQIYALTMCLPELEQFNLRSQLQRAGTSIVLNIAEGSTGQSDAEQNRLLGLALRSYMETVACFDLVERRGYLALEDLHAVRQLGNELFMKLQAFRGRLAEDNEKRSSVSHPRSAVR
jgi:four helix bundle protein